MYLLQDMEIHIQVRSRQIFYRSETLPILSALIQFLDQFFRHDLTCLVMFGIYLQHFRFEHPMLHDLGRQFHKVARNTRNSIIMYILKQIMQGMTKLMEQRPGFVCT